MNSPPLIRPTPRVATAPAVPSRGWVAGAVRPLAFQDMDSRYGAVSPTARSSSSCSTRYHTPRTGKLTHTSRPIHSRMILRRPGFTTLSTLPPTRTLRISHAIQLHQACPLVCDAQVRFSRADATSPRGFRFGCRVRPLDRLARGLRSPRHDRLVHHLRRGRLPVPQPLSCLGIETQNRLSRVRRRTSSRLRNEHPHRAPGAPRTRSARPSRSLPAAAGRHCRGRLRDFLGSQPAGRDRPPLSRGPRARSPRVGAAASSPSPSTTSDLRARAAPWTLESNASRDPPPPSGAAASGTANSTESRDVSRSRSASSAIRRGGSDAWARGSRIVTFEFTLAMSFSARSRHSWCQLATVSVTTSEFFGSEAPATIDVTTSFQLASIRSKRITPVLGWSRNLTSSARRNRCSGSSTPFAARRTFACVRMLGVKMTCRNYGSIDWGDFAAVSGILSRPRSRSGKAYAAV